MHWLFRSKPTLLQVEVVFLLGEFITDAKAKKDCQVQSIEERKVGRDGIVCRIQVMKGIFEKLGFRIEPIDNEKLLAATAIERLMAGLLEEIASQALTVLLPSRPLAAE